MLARYAYAVLAVAIRCANSLLGDLKPLLFGQENDVPCAVSPVLYGGCVYIKKDDCCTNALRLTTPASPPSNTLLYAHSTHSALRPVDVLVHVVLVDIRVLHIHGNGPPLPSSLSLPFVSVPLHERLFKRDFLAY
ncbi:hypothetical protein C8R45DRAFT_1101812 [Mycena sanguinolenta]|nr:hypothetical protein C8R45DRAFT_1101812 [Mycena sanguinolenta]